MLKVAGWNITSRAWLLGNIVIKSVVRVAVFDVVVHGRVAETEAEASQDSVAKEYGLGPLGCVAVVLTLDPSVVTLVHLPS